MTYQFCRTLPFQTVERENVNENLGALWLGDENVAKWPKVVWDFFFLMGMGEIENIQSHPARIL